MATSRTLRDSVADWAEARTGTIASSMGRAIAAPIPLRTVRRSRCFPVMKFIEFLSAWGLRLGAWQGNVGARGLGLLGNSRDGRRSGAPHRKQRARRHRLDER